MKKTVSSRFFQLPATKIGWWAGGLAIVSIVMLIINTLGLNPFEKMMDETRIPLQVYDFVILGSLMAGIVLGIIALTTKRERSWMVWLFMIPMLFFVAFLVVALIQRFTFDTRVEVAPTQDVNIPTTPVIFDDDGSPDGTSALLYLLSNPRAEVKTVSVSYGEAHPLVYIQHLANMLEDFGYGDVPLAAGPDAPLSGDNAFPDFVREASDDFWGFPHDTPEQLYKVNDSAELMVQTISTSQKPVTLLVSGALTNLAMALRIDPELSENIAAVYIMGGAVNVPGNLNDLLTDTTNSTAEWNFYVDPLAASEVFNAGLPLFLVPLDATNQVKLAEKDISVWRKGGKISDLAVGIYQTQMSSWGVEEVEMWDLVTAVIMMNPEYCVFTPLRLEVVTAEGDTQGQTRLVDGESNVNVCQNPDGEAIKQELAKVFSSRK